jgi:hypothetical protein
MLSNKKDSSAAAFSNVNPQTHVGQIDQRIKYSKNINETTFWQQI